MSIRRAKRQSQFVIISNAVFLSRQLSWRAMGLLSYILSKPDDWTIMPNALVKVTENTVKNDRKNTVYEIIKELKDVGFITMQRHCNGSVEYTVHDEPVPRNREQAETGDLCSKIEPIPKKPNQAIPVQDNWDVLLNTDVLPSTDFLVIPPNPQGGDGVEQTASPSQSVKKGKLASDVALLESCDLKSVPVELVAEYVKYRRDIKHPLKTSKGLQAQINTLDALGDVAAMQAALANTMDNEYRKIVAVAPTAPSSPTVGMVAAAASHGLTNGTVASELALMIQYYKTKGFTVWDYEAAFSKWVAGKARFEEQRTKTSAKGFSSWQDTSWMDEVDPSLFGATESEWRNA